MKKLVIASDSFKGTLSSIEICEIAKEVCEKNDPSCELVCIPVADGGEGTVDAFVYATGAERKYCFVSGPLFEKVNACYALLSDTAIIEMAQAAGLPLAGEKANPLNTTTFGVGELIADAVASGAKNIIIGLGGSATNDIGFGMLAALGVKFFDKNGMSFVPVGGTIKDIANIDTRDFYKKYANIKFTAMCDVTNPLYGTKGAAYIYGAQKGASSSDIVLLDEGLRYAEKFLSDGTAQFEGAGAAGGMGAGCMEFLHASLVPGSKAILDATGFDEKIKDADLVISGEGKVDYQSFYGKLLSEVLKRCKNASADLAIIAGIATDDAKELFGKEKVEIYETSNGEIDFEVIKKNAKLYYADTLEKVLNIYSK